MLSTIEKNTILRVIEKHNGNITKAAKELGLTRRRSIADLANMIFKQYQWRILIRVLSFAH
jgi:transcriptional regulator with PAS, ATPase and Fis domain